MRPDFPTGQSYNTVGRRERAVVIYLDLVFILNTAVDVLALYMTARLSGLPLQKWRLMITAVLGGLYGTCALLPPLQLLAGFLPQMVCAFFLVRLSFGKQQMLSRIYVLFYFLSCTLGGAMTAISQSLFSYGIYHTLQSMNWKVFFLVAFISYLFLSIVFRGSAKHAVFGQLCHVCIELNEKTVSLDALWDTGHTLCDPCSGLPVLTAWYTALEPLWSKDAEEIINHLDSEGCLWCAEQISTVLPGRFRLIPYRAVGVDRAMLLAFRADKLIVDGNDMGAMMIALSPTPVSDGGGYNALWGGERKGKLQDVA